MNMLKILLILLLLQNIAFAGWVITEESGDRFGNRSIQTTFIQNNVIRYETPTSIAIMDFNTKLITIVFSEYKYYWTGTSEEFKLSTIAIYDAQIENMLVGLPKHERTELDSIYSKLKQQMLDSVDNIYRNDILVKDADDSLDVYGLRTTKYNVIIDSIIRESIWHSTEITPYTGINTEEMVITMQQLNLAPGKGPIASTKKYLKLLETGILLKYIEFSPNGGEFVTTVTDIRELKINTDFFIPPSNYMKVALFDVLYLTPQKSKEKDSY